MLAQLLSQSDSGSNGGGATAAFLVVFYIAVIVLLVASYWKIFSKAGQPGWTALIPILNTIVELKLIKRPIWWIILLLIPCVNVIMLIIIMIDLAKVFGKSVGFAIGLILLPIIFLPILAFGEAQYQEEPDPLF